MKIRLRSILHLTLIAFGVVLVLSVCTRLAAAEKNKLLARVDIPFSFERGGRSMPAGGYRIERETKYLLLFHGPLNVVGYILMHPAAAADAPSHGRIIFDHLGGKYFLRQIWTAGSNEVLECPQSSAEKDSLQAKSNQTPNSVELVLSEDGH